jgi:branched-chain amino acid transport system substrate-binding protein
MKRREFLKYSVATAVAAPFVRPARADSGVVKVGLVGPKTGPLAPGAAVTHYPPFRLWAHEVNARGGLKLKNGQAKIELIEYDDHTQPGETIKAVERLATVEKADAGCLPLASILRRRRPLRSTAIRSSLYRASPIRRRH